MVTPLRLTTVVRHNERCGLTHREERAKAVDIATNNQKVL